MFDGGRSPTHVPAHPGGGKRFAQCQRGRLGQQAPEWQRRQVDHVDRMPADRKVIGKLAADEAGAKNGDAVFAFDGGAKTGVVAKVVDRQDRAGGITP